MKKKACNQKSKQSLPLNGAEKLNSPSSNQPAFFSFSNDLNRQYPINGSSISPSLTTTNYFSSPFNTSLSRITPVYPPSLFSTSINPYSPSSSFNFINPHSPITTLISHPSSSTLLNSNLPSSSSYSSYFCILTCFPIIVKNNLNNNDEIVNTFSDSSSSYKSLFFNYKHSPNEKGFSFIQVVFLTEKRLNPFSSINSSPSSFSNSPFPSCPPQFLIPSNTSVSLPKSQFFPSSQTTYSTTSYSSQLIPFHPPFPPPFPPRLPPLLPPFSGLYSSSPSLQPSSSSKSLSSSSSSSSSSSFSYSSSYNFPKSSPYSINNINKNLVMKQSYPYLYFSFEQFSNLFISL
jgi:hypothetical protein